MIQPKPDHNSDKLIPYLCRFQLILQDLEAQMYFPSSFKIAWKTKDNDQLAATTGFVPKNQLHIARFEQTFEAQTIMLYNTQTKSYVDKDTFIVVSYYLNSKPLEVKQLGKITLKMSRFMEEKGDETVRKGETVLGSTRAEDNGDKIGWQKRNLSKNKSVDDIKCLRLEGSQYLAKLKFKCSLVQSSLSKLTLSSISAEEFNQPLGEYMKTVKKPLVNKSPQPKPVSVSIKTKQPLPKAISQRLPKDTVINNPSKVKPLIIPVSTQSQMPGFGQLQNNSQCSVGQQQQLKQSIHTQNTKESTFQESLIIPSSINQPSKNQHQEKIVAQLEHLEKDNLRLMTMCEEHKSFIIEQEKTIKRLKQDCYELQDQVKEKQLYLENNLDKLQALDQYKYQVIQLKEYITKLQQRLTMIYQQKPITLQKLWKTVVGYRQSLISKPSGSNLKKNQSLAQSIVKINSFSLIDENSDQKKGLSQSVNYINQKKGLAESVNYIRPATIRDSRQKQTHKSIPEHLFMVSSSEIQLTNSQMRQIEGSTVRMQKQLSFMQTELYQVKGNVMLQQQRYEQECKMHSETKVELFTLQEKMKGLEKQLKQLRTVNNEKQALMKQLTQLQQDNQCLHQQIDKLQQAQILMKQQTFKLRQSKQDQEYQLSVIIKHQKLQLQSIKQQLNKQNIHIKQLQQLLNSQRQKLKQQSQESIKMKSQLSSVIKENFRLGKQIQMLKSKQTEIGSYLSGLEGEFNQVQKIVEEKQDNQEHLHQLILEKQEIIAKNQTEITEFTYRVKNFDLLVETLEKQLALQRLKSSQSQSQSSLASKPNQKPHRQHQKQSNLKLTVLQTSNNELIKKNKQLINILSKNAAALVAFEKQKKELSTLNTMVKQLQEIKKQKQLVEIENNKLMKDNEKLVNQFRQIEEKHRDEVGKVNKDKQYIKDSLDKLQKTNRQLQELNVNLKQQLSQKQQQLTEKDIRLSEVEVKLNKLNKQKKLSQQSIKFLQTKTKTYQSLILQHQSSITQKQSIIKSLQTKLKLFETGHYNNSLKTSEYGNAIDQGLSQIKLQSEIYDSRKILQVDDSRNLIYRKNYFSASNSKSNKLTVNKQFQRDDSTYKKDQSKQEEPHNESSYLISPLSQNQQEKVKRHQGFSKAIASAQDNNDIRDYSMKKRQDDIANNPKSDNSKQKTTILINMIQSYLDVKKKNQNNLQLQVMINRLKQFRQNDHNQMNLLNYSQQIVKKLHQILNELNKYKTKLIKDNKNKPKSTIDLLVQPIKSIEQSINSLLTITLKLT